MNLTNLAEAYSIDCIVEVNFIKPRVGNFPVGKTPEGVTCIVEPNTKKFFEYGSIWECRVMKVSKSSLIIKPIKIIRTADEETRFQLDGLKSLIDQGSDQGIFKNIKPNKNRS